MKMDAWLLTSNLLFLLTMWKIILLSEEYEYSRNCPEVITFPEQRVLFFAFPKDKQTKQTKK